MNVRQAKKILRRWSREFGTQDRPRDVFRAGRFPWPWATWVEAHRVWQRHVVRHINRHARKLRRDLGEGKPTNALVIRPLRGRR